MKIRYMHFNHMFTYLSTDESSLTVVEREYYGFLTCGGHIASV
jgi:hypothetical protein